MVQIKSDCEKTQTHLESICDFLSEKRNLIHPDLEIHHKDGKTSVHAPMNLQADRILKISHDYLVPYQNFDFDIEDGRIIIAHHDRNHNADHLTLMQMMIDFHNESGKFKTHLQECPLLQYKDHSDVIDLLLRGRHGADIDLISKIIDKPEFFDELALLTFFKNRLVFCSLFDPASAPTEVFMPVIDLLNHNHHGAGYDNVYHTEGAFMALSPSQPEEGSGEVFANYGRFDALDTFLHYGFADDSAPFVRAAPMHIALAKDVTIEIEAFVEIAEKDKIPPKLQDLHYYFPKIRFERSETSKAVLSHILIPDERAPLSMRRILNFTLRTLMPGQNQDIYVKMIKDIEAGICETTRNFYENLEKSVPQNKGKDRFIDNVLALITTQKQKILHFENFAKP